MFGDNKQISIGLRNKDLKVYKDLFFQYHGRLTLFACKFTGDMETAQDIVQDAFMALWEKSDTIAIKESPKAYLFQAVRNRSLNHFRHMGTRQNVLENLVAQIDSEERKVYSDFNNPFHSLLELELGQKITEVVDAMPEKCREVFVLSRQKELRNREIAEKMGISVKMVEKYISKALRILRLELSDYMNILILVLLMATGC
jgi:RNA polymerase sigma-70 factor (ECF subfamily)